MPALAAETLMCSLILGPRCPPRKKAVPCSSDVRGPLLVRSSLSGLVIVLTLPVNEEEGHRPYLSQSAYPGSVNTITDRKSTRLNSSHLGISYAVFCL